MNIRKFGSELIAIGRSKSNLTDISAIVAECCRDFNVSAYETISAWKRTEPRSAGPIVLLYVAGQKRQYQLMADIRTIRSVAAGAWVIVLSSVVSARVVVRALEEGARGYIPADTSLAVAVAAIHLVRAGGIFVPADSFKCLPGQSRSHVSAVQPKGVPPFTKRQLAVLRCLQQGEPNKIIADRLRIKENTVKVHVYNIMQKLKARSRTETVYFTRHMFDETQNT